MKNRPINNLYNIDSLTKTDYDRNLIFFSAFKKIIISAAIVIFVLSLSITLYVIKSLNELPDISLLSSYPPEQSTQIYDINNKLITSIHGDEDRNSVALAKISPYLKWAVISIEDNRFYNHNGVDLMGTIRAFYNNALNRDSIQGGSTITQQLVKNFFLTPEKSIKRKLMEAILAVKVEWTYSKNNILEKYLNQIYWGNMSYGIEKAARKYFKKSAKNLNLSEASMLAGLIKAPELYSPYNNLAETKKRQKIVLDKMCQFGYITVQQKYKAYAGPIKLASRKFTYSKYVYFVDYVTYVLRNKYGDNTVRRGGLKVYTTLDPEIQQIAEKTINEGMETIPKGSGVREAALVSINVKNGYIQALVGGIDYNKSQFNRATLAHRPVGSGFKPVVYLTGLRTGIITPDSIIYDAPVSYKTKWNVWRPHNWDGKYLGKMTVRKALTLSRNTPTVRVALKAGIDKIIETSRLLGIKSYMRHGFSMVLGSSEITPLEVANVYSTLARDGVYLEPTAIRYIKDSKDNIIEVSNNTPIRVVNSEFVRMLNSILIDAVEKGTGKSAKLMDRQVAGKTGTTDSVKDIWFNGFTPDTATTIWMGNDENTKLSGVFSSNCAILWNKFSTEYYKIKKIPPEAFLISEMEIKKQEAEKLKKENKKPNVATDIAIEKPEKNENIHYNTSKNYKVSKNNSYKKPETNETKDIKPPPRTYIPDNNDYEQRYQRMYQQNQPYNSPYQMHNN